MSQRIRNDQGSLILFKMKNELYFLHTLDLDWMAVGDFDKEMCQK